MTGEKKERRKWRPWLLASLGAMLLILGAWWLWGGPRLWTGALLPPVAGSVRCRGRGGAGGGALEGRPRRSLPERLAQGRGGGRPDRGTSPWGAGGWAASPAIGRLYDHRRPARRLAGNGYGADGRRPRCVFLAGGEGGQRLSNLGIGRGLVRLSHEILKWEDILSSH